MEFKKIFYLIIFTLFLINVSYASYNENYTDLVLDNNGWCAGLDITFKVMNKTDYENKKEIESNLCKEDENPKDDHCSQFHILKDIPVKIYNGPLEGLGLLFDSKTDSNGEFRFNFENPNQYLIEIKPTGNYNDYKQIIDILYCKNAQNQKKSNQVNSTTLLNQTFEYKKDGFIIEISNTDMTDLNNISIYDIVPGEYDIKTLNNSLKSFLITTKSKNYSNIKISFDLNLPSNSQVLLFKYDKDKKLWNEIKDFTYNNKTNKIILDKADFGIYSTAFKILEKNENKLDNQKINEDNTINETIIIKNSSNNTSIVFYLFLAVFIIALILGWYFLFTNKKNLHYNQDKKNLEEPEILNTYSQIYERTKEYINRYKESYNKEQIKKALIDANIPTDIIEKLFREIY